MIQVGFRRSPVIDAQVHIWKRESLERPWPASERARAHGEVFEAAQLRTSMRSIGVDGAILVPPSWEGVRNDTCIEAASNYPTRFAVMARISLDKAEGIPQFEQAVAEPSVLGLRLTFAREPLGSMLAAGEFDWLWKVAAARDVPIMVSVPGQLDAVRRLLGKFEGLRLIVDHMGNGVNATPDDVARAAIALESLARFESLTVKASALPCFSRMGFPFSDVVPALVRVINAFSPSRVFWGSDLTRVPCPYDESLGMFSSRVLGLTDWEIDGLCGDSIARWLGWYPWGSSASNTIDEGKTK